MTKILRGLTLAVFATTTTVWAQTAQAEYPERAITIVVPFSAGGNTDSIARIAAQHLSDELGQSVVIENRGGAGGTIGSATVAQADKDGYTLLFGTTGTHNVNPNLREVDYNPVTDFQPISNGVMTSVLIVAHPSVEADTLSELIALTSAENAPFLNFSSGGVGTVAHVAGELYNQKTGSELLHIPYKGAGDALNDLIAGRVQLNMNNLPAFLPHLEAGTVKALAIAAPERSNLLPDIPTTSEGGLDGFEMGSWYGLFAPAGVPRDVVDTLFAAMSTLDENAEAVERYNAIGLEPVPSASPEDFATLIEEQYNWWADILDNPVFKK